jgi:SHS2 domain-containing protein
MGHDWGEHVGELELRVTAPAEAGVFAEAALALGELLGEEDDAAPVGALEWRHVGAGADAADRGALLAAWLDELVFLAETDGFVPAAVEDVVLGPGAVRARVGGRRGAPPHLVKAVTYHRLAFAPAAEGGWHAVAVLDV